MAEVKGVPQETLQQIVEEDRRLEDQAGKSARALMWHRWHWTLDESNPDRVSIRAYAEAVERDYSTIHNDVTGYLLLTNVDGERPITPTDARERAGLSQETAAVTEAVAKERGISMVNARQHHGDEVQRVRDIAHVRAEQHGTSVVDEVDAAVQEMQEEKLREEQRRKEDQERKRRREEESKRRHTFRYNEVESQLGKAREHLLKAARVIEGVPFDPEERDLLSVTLNNLRRMVDMMDEAIVGKRRPDWGEKIQLVGGGLEE